MAAPLSPVPPPEDAFDGNAAWRRCHTLRDGSVITIRPIAPEDREELRRAFAETSAKTRYRRFLRVTSELSDETLTYLTDVDQHNHIALVATITSPDLKRERGVGVARVIRLEDDVAEAAITVIDDMQKRGVGTALAVELEGAARARGIRVIRAEVLEDNEAMRAILEGAGAARVETRTGSGTLSYDLRIAPTPISRGRLLDLLRGAAQTMAVSIRKLVPPA